jgi:hypothetical protein
MVVLTLDQRDSRAGEDEVAVWSSRLNEEFAREMRLPFVRTAGDEMQALFIDAPAVVEVASRALESEVWWVGIGIGDPRPLGDTARDSRGPAFRNARAAVNEAKRRSWACAVAGDPAWAATALDGCLAMLERIRRTRTSRGQQLAALALAGVRQADIASRLHITRQAVSKQLRAAGLEEERLGREAAIQLLRNLTT